MDVRDDRLTGQPAERQPPDEHRGRALLRDRHPEGAACPANVALRLGALLGSTQRRRQGRDGRDLAADLTGRIRLRVHVDVSPIGLNRIEHSRGDVRGAGCATRARSAERHDHRACDATRRDMDVRGDAIAGEATERQLPVEHSAGVRLRQGPRKGPAGRADVPFRSRGLLSGDHRRRDLDPRCLAPRSRGAGADQS